MSVIYNTDVTTSDSFEFIFYHKFHFSQENTQPSPKPSEKFLLLIIKFLLLQEIRQITKVNETKVMYLLVKDSEHVSMMN